MSLKAGYVMQKEELKKIDESTELTEEQKRAYHHARYSALTGAATILGGIGAIGFAAGSALTGGVALAIKSRKKLQVFSVNNLVKILFYATLILG